MKKFSFSNKPGVICGRDNNKDLFIRMVRFEAGYTENDYHNHPNSFEFYVVLAGSINFVTEIGNIQATEGSIIYFEQAEKHKIAEVHEKTIMLLLKKIESTKE